MNTWLLFWLVGGMLLLMYALVYPRLVGGSLKRLLISDTLVTVSLFVVVGTTFWGSDAEFDFGLFSLNWFWATLLCAVLVESVLFPWYAQRFGIDLTQPLE